MTVHALGTLGGTIRNRNNPICVASPKVAKTRTMVSVACRCHRHYRAKLRQCKHSLFESCHPRWQRQVRQLFSCRKTANSITTKLRQWKYGLMLRQNKLECLSLASIFRLPLWRLELLTKGRLPAKQRTNGLAYLSWKISFRALTT
jgi:hypothetical protein